MASRRGALRPDRHDPVMVDAATTRPGGFRQLLRTGNFRLLWFGGALSAVGDQFDLIAFPWLTLMVTGDPLAVGTVIAVGSVPALFCMVIGGAVVDRFSPRRVILASNALRIVLSAGFAALILTGHTQLWMIYLFSLLKGIADGFYYPAQAAIVPWVVEPGQLRQANAALQTTVELGGFVGPAVAGWLIAAFSSGEGGSDPNLTGVGLAFVVVSGAFLLALLAVAALRPGNLRQAQDEETQAADEAPAGIVISVVQGIRFVRANAAMFSLFLLVAGIELLVEGPVIVGIPILADTRLAQGALALGVISSAYAAGSLGGSLLAGALPPPRGRIGPVLTAQYVLMGILLMPFGILNALWQAVGITLLLGVMGGYTDIMFMTWLQGRTPPRMMGRVMSLLMASQVSLSPFSNAIAGALIKFSLPWAFVGAGGLMSLLSLGAGLRREIWEMRMSDSANPTEEE